MENEIIYGTTNIVGIIEKKGLIFWAVNQCIQNLKNIWKAGKSYDEIEINNILQSSKDIHKEKTDQAAMIGEYVHSWIEKYIKAKINNTELPKLPVNEKIINSVKAFLKWESENKVEWIDSEKKILSLKYKYAGTLDAEAIVNGELSIIDFKTSNGIWDEYLLQVSAYLKAREEETKQDYKNVYIIRIGKDGELETKKVNDKELKDCFKAFLGCLEVYKWKMKRKGEEINKLKTNK
ncbi:MAG TPA: hypothetical protein PKV21_07720 [bacterium]|nr:hypothetical protein [bacterium]